MKLTVKSAIVVLPVALALAGCGSSGHKTSHMHMHMSMRLSRAALVKKVDAICTQRNDVITAGASKMLAGGRLPTPKVFMKFAFGTIVPQTSMEIMQLSMLTPPTSISRGYQKWLAELRSTLARIKANPMIIQHASNFTAVNHDAAALGMSSNCDVGPSS